ncbi:MAG: tobe domain protein [Zunongwangia sp.]|uniref:Tobe domain protein n=1 Tax=Zunongwangia profunda TaxID=398743 RepID=A0A3D5J568_9FLAO|nr:tobe domain protein [Zunongwangia profunda]MAC66170.1 tobe domain protein [Flavobacteriaceae bacterium]MAO38579.1 tobe domain protein [Zunongwangia sp.]MAG87688.1 tobe domain protein [Flavobacteriaceae bacterium]MAS70864.1 tobe domain protein [Zunongwangia sp.]MCC4230753.1 tobe domain protein [Zunongwangia profunda]
MNKLPGKIKHIKNSEYLSEVTIALENNAIFNVFLVETPQTASYLQLEQKINLLFKETEVIISKNLTPDISIQNQLKAEIIEIKPGKILSEIILKSHVGEIKSLLGSTLLQQMNFAESQEVLILVKANEIMLSE